MPQITHTDTSSADTNITAATQINHTDTSSADTNITAAPQITHTDTSSADTNITAATQINHTDTSSAHTNITAATQIAHTDTSSADTNITAATKSQLDTLSGSLQTRSPLWRALRRSRGRCGRLRMVADTDTTFREHSLTPRPPNETGTLATHSGKMSQLVSFSSHARREASSNLCHLQSMPLPSRALKTCRTGRSSCVSYYRLLDIGDFNGSLIMDIC